MMERLERIVVAVGLTLALTYLLCGNAQTRYRGSVWERVAEATERMRD